MAVTWLKKKEKNETIAAELSNFHTALQAQEIKRIHITETRQRQMKRTIRFQTINILLHNNKHNLNTRHRYKNDLKRKHNWKCGEIVLPHACVNRETEWVGETGGGGESYSTADEYFVWNNKREKNEFVSLHKSPTTATMTTITGGSYHVCDTNRRRNIENSILRYIFYEPLAFR